MFNKLLSALGLAPKTLPQATETLASAKTFAESVNAMFVAADLNLENLLAAGPDALKLHIESVDTTEELAVALQENETLAADLESAKTLRDGYKTLGEAKSEVFKAVGFDDGAATAEDFKTAFEAHVTKATTLALAKTGHPPAHVPAVTEAITPAKTDAEIYAEYQKMDAGPVRLDFFSKHEAALKRALAGARK